MINPGLEESIRFYIQQGYTEQQIVDYLISFGYPVNDVNDTFASVSKNPVPEMKEKQPEKPSEFPQEPKSYRQVFIIAGIIAFILIAGVSAAVYWYMGLPVCGNGEVEKGETMETCCSDTGCIGQQGCVSNSCIEPSCGYCEYLEDHYCRKWACCESRDCAEDAYCDGHTCVSLDCLPCQYYLNHECIDYPCCIDSDCGTNYRCVEHACISNCGSCQYMVDGICADHECCNDSMCAGSQRCERNNCVPVICGAGDIIKDHQCTAAERCQSNNDCNDSNDLTLDLCIGAGTATSHCTHLETDVCSRDSDCDDDDISTEDKCVGTPKHCISQKIDCNEFGVRCTNSDGFCEGNLTVADDTAYCCIGTCITLPDLYIKSMDEDNRVLEVEIYGNHRVNETRVFRIYAFENNTRMNTIDGLQYAQINGKNSTDTFYFNFTIYNATINVTASVDYTNLINETNETNNNKTITVIV